MDPIDKELPTTTSWIRALLVNNHISSEMKRLLLAHSPYRRIVYYLPSTIYSGVLSIDRPNTRVY